MRNTTNTPAHDRVTTTASVLRTQVQDELMELTIRKNLGARSAERTGSGAASPIHEVEDVIRAELETLRQKSSWTTKKPLPTFAPGRLLVIDEQAGNGARSSAPSHRLGVTASGGASVAFGGRRPMTTDDHALRVTKMQELRAGGLKITLSDGTFISLSMKQLLAARPASSDTSQRLADELLAYCCYDGCDSCL